MRRSFTEQEIRCWFRAWCNCIPTFSADNYCIDMRKEFGIPLTLKFPLNQHIDEMGAPVTFSMIIPILGKARILAKSTFDSSFSTCTLVGLAEINASGEAVFTVSDSEANSDNILNIALNSVPIKDDGGIGETPLRGGKSLWHIARELIREWSGEKRRINARIYACASEEGETTNNGFMELRNTRLGEMVSMVCDGDKMQKLYQLNCAELTEDFEAIMNAMPSVGEDISGEIDPDGFWRLSGSSGMFLCGLASKEYFSTMRKVLPGVLVFKSLLSVGLDDVFSDEDF